MTKKTIALTAAGLVVAYLAVVSYMHYTAPNPYGYWHEGLRKVEYGKENKTSYPKNELRVTLARSVPYGSLEPSNEEKLKVVHQLAESVGGEVGEEMWEQSSVYVIEVPTHSYDELEQTIRLVASDSRVRYVETNHDSFVNPL
jgi:hypothetical protein